MAKELANPLQLVVDFEAVDADITVELSAHYKLTDEYGLEMRKGMPITLTPSQETNIKDFTKNVILPQIKSNEGIA